MKQRPCIEIAWRVVGGIIIGAIVYFSISFVSIWDDLPQALRLGIAGFTGILFATFGKCIWTWIDEITDWT